MFKNMIHRVFWIDMKKDIQAYTDGCIDCKTYRSKVLKNQGQLQLYAHGTYPFEIVHCDITGPFPESSEGFQYIFVLIDRYSRWLELIPLKDIRAITIAEAFYDVFITRYGVPKRLITDRGSQFTSIMFEKLNDLLKIKHRFTTSYHPQTNGVVDRVNREISKSLAILVNQEGLEWTKLLQSVAFAFRTSYHSVLGLSPYKLLFGRDPSLPTDVFFNIDDEENFGDFSTEVQERIQESHQIMVKNQETFDKRIKAYYDRTHKAVSFARGDFVMLFTDKYLQGNRKFQTRFSGPYVVIEQVSPVNVILQHPETGHEKRVHVLRTENSKIALKHCRCHICRRIPGGLASQFTTTLLTMH